MCGRYSLHASPEVVALQFALDGVPRFRPSYNISPGTEVLAVGESRVAALHYWGLRGRVVNARAETIDEKFAPAFRLHRCLVPASGYYEWKTSAGRKYPWYMRPLDAGLFGLAAIAAQWNGRKTLSLITTRPNAVVASIHDRMPAIIAPRDYQAWLDPANGDAKRLLRPSEERIAAHPVGTRVSRPGNDDAALIEPTDGPPQRDLL